jgi:hypothetical protein
MAHSKSSRRIHPSTGSRRKTFLLNADAYQGGIALWGAVPAVYDTTTLPLHRGIHVHARLCPRSDHKMDRTFPEVKVFSSRLGTDSVLVSELDAIYYMVSSVFGHEVSDVRCTYCGHGHLDRDRFSIHPHLRHVCAECGSRFRDTRMGIGNPIAALRKAWGTLSSASVVSKTRLHISQSDFLGGIRIWGSNRACLWTANRPEEEGIHVHAFRKPDDELPDRDGTYGEVIIDGIRLDSVMVRLLMAQNTLPSLRHRVRSLICPKCNSAIRAIGTAAYSPTSNQQCSHCAYEFATSGRIRKVVANPLVDVFKQLGHSAPRKPLGHDLQLQLEFSEGALQSARIPPAAESPKRALLAG